MADGLQAVFLVNRAQIIRFLRARGAGDEAEDLAQDLWLKLDAKREGPIGDPLGYLYRMANNLMIDRHRTTRRRQAREETAAFAPGDQPTAETALIARERLRSVDRSLAMLGERTSSIFRRFRLDGISQRDIAQEQGISLSAVEKHLRKAYRLLLELRGSADAEPADTQRLNAGGASIDPG